MSSIAFLNNYFPSLSGTFIYREVIELKKRGLTIKTFSVRKPKKADLSEESHHLIDSTVYLLPVNLLEFTKAHIYFFLRSPIVYFGLLIFLISRHFENNFKDRLRTLAHFFEGVYFARLVKKESDIFHLHAHYASHPCSIIFVASKLLKIPFSFTAHAYDIWEDKLFVKDKLKYSKFVITCTKFGKKRIGELYGKEYINKIVPIYHGIDLFKFKPVLFQNKQNKITILHVGRLHPEKAQKTIIAACKNLKEAGYDFNCIIIGDGDLKNELQEMVQELELKKNVVLVGRLFQEDIVKYYQTASVFVLTSITENLPNVLVESLATKLAVIAPEINGIPELVQHNKTGLLIRPANSDDLTKALISIFDESFRENLAENGYRLVKDKFDANKCMDQLVNLYKKNGVI